MILRLSPVSLALWGAGPEAEAPTEPTGKITRVSYIDLIRTVTSLAGVTTIGKVLIRVVSGLLIIWALSGCAVMSGEVLSETIRAMASSNATVCVSIDTLMYGAIKIVRTNAGAAIVMNDGNCAVQHQRGPAVEAPF